MIGISNKQTMSWGSNTRSRRYMTTLYFYSGTIVQTQSAISPVGDGQICTAMSKTYIRR